MNNYGAQNKVKATRTSEPNRRHDEPAYAGRHNSNGRYRQSEPDVPERESKLPEKRPDDRPDHQADDPLHGLGWLPISLLGLVVICLILAAWVWFEILWM